VLAYFQGESACPVVKNLLKQAVAGDASALLRLINFGGIIQTIERKLGDETSREIFRDILSLPIQLAEVNMDRVLAAASVKAHNAISYGDAFAVALAQELSAAVVTDDPESKRLSRW
jgi:predicted nucleic acid-binding protein